LGLYCFVFKLSIKFGLPFILRQPSTICHGSRMWDRSSLALCVSHSETQTAKAPVPGDCSYYDNKEYKRWKSSSQAHLKASFPVLYVTSSQSIGQRKSCNQSQPQRDGKQVSVPPQQEWGEKLIFVEQ
jgi:hypothetical protein